MKKSKQHLNKQTILYLSPVDWRWIKQRPQFLAEEMARHFHIVVLYPWKNRRKGLQKKERSSLPLHRYFMLPSLGGRFAMIGKINELLGKWQLFIMLKKIRPDYLWLSHPMQRPMIPARFYGKIIYDCMDDYEAIEWNKEKSGLVVAYEKDIVQIATHIFASSINLIQILQRRYGVETAKITLLRNGHNGETVTAARNRQQVESCFKIGYFGTIGRWFDFPLLLDSLSVFPNVEYHIYGPTEKGVEVPAHQRLICHGVVAHDRLVLESQTLNALIMPFVMNDIVRSVDPVKLYEYIQMRLPILSIRYPEIERFFPFVFFYTDRQNFFDRMNDIVKNPDILYSEEQANTFLNENSWQKRADTVFNVLCKAEEPIL